ncbi:MAG: peptide chain release factor 3 [Eggerthellaceae bacterium]|nr:peptide chain release factor 3 [Eggerthellaceae bacterium]
MTTLADEVASRRIFAIISHPDAGKTTLTEKLLLYTGSIQTAGSVKGKSSSKHAVSDWMDIEKERGISVTSSVLQFRYGKCCVNILDTPGHQDFSEDTYRTLMAADAAVMVIDAAKGVEAQTKKLFRVCTLRHIPIFTFVNKLDREARDPFDLMEEIEEVLGIGTYPMNWPIGCGQNFRGVFDRRARRVIAFEGDGRANATKKVAEVEADLGDATLDELIGRANHENLVDDIELLDGAGDELDYDAVRTGRLTPVFFGSALTNFGVQPFLEEFLRLAPSPLPYLDQESGSPVDPSRDEFSGFVFKIQANMDKNHRDRIAFLRICSGKFERGMDAYHVQGGRKIKLATGTSLMADDRSTVDVAYAGDIVGLFDPGLFSIGDTLCTGKTPVRFPAIPTFAPELFSRITQVNTLKRKQFVKGMEELAQEGAVQIFREPGFGMESVIVGVVGTLQLDVLERRLKNEYGVEVRRSGLPYTEIRRIANDADDFSVEKLRITRDALLVEDMRGRNLLLFTSVWGMNYVTERNPDLVLEEVSNFDLE